MGKQARKFCNWLIIINSKVSSERPFKPNVYKRIPMLTNIITNM
uniref:Uncharacterized protein n=1 Tax=uncultured Desulfobacterium sp. TaxID=201089 RepID=E1YLA9_9BACT|nr:unknown protein [uncultured Desulfobacterium sp.]